MSSLHEMSVLGHIHKLQAAFIVVSDHLDHLLGSLKDHHLKPFNLRQSFSSAAFDPIALPNLDICTGGSEES